MTHLHALALIRDPAGAVLLLRSTGNLPGGPPHPGEPAHHAAARHLTQQTGLQLPLTHVIALDHTPEAITLTLDGGTLTSHETAHHRELAWVPTHLLPLHTTDAQQHRIHAAIDATERGNELPLR